METMKDYLKTKIKDFSLVSYYQGQYDELHAVIKGLSAIVGYEMSVAEIVELLEKWLEKAKKNLDEKKKQLEWDN